MNNIYDFDFYPLLILRTPSYSYQCYDDSGMQELLKDLFFRSAIYLGSANLYEALMKKDFTYEKLSEKEKLALRKYLNRMCFRPTPFGLFAGISVVEWNDKNPSLQIGSEINAHIHFSYGASVHFAEELLKEIPLSEQTFILNHLLYKAGREYRYIHYNENTNTSERDFFVDSFTETDPLTKIISYSSQEHSLQELIRFISSEFDTSEEDALSFIKQLIEKQILLSTLTPNIIGRDYLSRIASLMAQKTQHLFCLENILEKINGLNNISAQIKTADFEKSLSNLNIRTEKGDDIHRDQLYVNLEKPQISGGPGRSYQEKILDGLYCINKLMPAHPIDALEEFASAFGRKFGNRTIPLLYALDPEVGVGYAPFTENHDPSVLLSDIHVKDKRSPTSLVEWTPVHQLLMDKWTSIPFSNNGEGAMIIEKEDLVSLPSSDENNALPPSMAVLFRILDDHVYIEQAGGASALGLSGRFTLFNDSILTMTKEIARIEDTSNPDVLFADIAHINDLHTANINRRETLRDYEILLTAGSCRDFQSQILPRDLRVSLRGKKIILWSEKLQRIIIPRLSSAYNYTRSNLPVFRFLCDLQNQGIKTSFSFDLSSFFPGLIYYPRVQYRSAILQLATWHIKTEKWKSELRQGSELFQINRIGSLLKRMHLPEFISANEGDHQVILDRGKETDMQILLRMVKNKDTVVIKEFPFLHVTKQIIRDKYKRPYINQFVASLYHHHRVYNPVPYLSDNKSKPSVKRKYPPGSEWLYFKIYCHPLRSDEILIKYIKPSGMHWQTEGILKQWFFIRYRDPEYHLRVRFKIDPANTQKVVTDFARVISNLTDTGIIQNYSITIYEREVERYSSAFIEDVEKLFCASTLLVVEYLKAADDGILNWNDCTFAFISLLTLLDTFKYTLQDKGNILYHLYHSFSSEFEQTKELNSQLRKKFREVRRSFQEAAGERCSMDIPTHVLFKEMQIFKNKHILMGMRMEELPAAQKNKLVTDFIPMHLNRLFRDNQRKQEMVLYYCFWKYFFAERLRMQAATHDSGYS